MVMAQLLGMNAIAQKAGVSNDVALDWIRNCGMPAEKIGGVWVSDADLIDEWRRNRLLGLINNKTKAIPAKKKGSGRKMRGF
jgi:hypothetical protein